MADRDDKCTWGQRENTRSNSPSREIENPTLALSRRIEKPTLAPGRAIENPTVVCQISSKSDDFSLRYGDLTIFKMTAERHLGF